MTSYFQHNENTARRRVGEREPDGLPDMVELTDTIRAHIERQRLAWQTGIDVEPMDVEHVTL